MLIDVDSSGSITERILVKRKSDNFDFFILVTYEKLQEFCPHRETIGHGLADCKKGLEKGIREFLNKELDKPVR